MPSYSFVKIEGGWPCIDVGALRHAITIMQLGPSSPPTFDASGAAQQSWSEFTQAMAAIETVRGIDVIRSGQTTTQLFLTVTMWWQPGILPSMRVQTDSGSTYIIQSVENILEMGVVMVLNCLGLGANE